MASITIVAAILQDATVVLVVAVWVFWPASQPVRVAVHEVMVEQPSDSVIVVVIDVRPVVCVNDSEQDVLVTQSVIRDGDEHCVCFSLS